MSMVKRSILPVLLVSTLLLSACSAMLAQTRISDRVAPPGVRADSPPAQAPPPEEAVSMVPVEAPAPPPVSGRDQQDSAPGHDEPVPVPERPAVTWMPRGIGLPLVPSDPALADRKVVMLTFDDGPSEWTPAILEALAKEGVKAAFFITGYGARSHPELVERIHREGHILGVHTMSHPNMTKLTREEQVKEIQPLVELIERVTGKRPRYFRPPFGAYNDSLRQLLAEMDMELINWTSGSRDWHGVVNGYKDPNQVVSDVMGQLFPGAVFLFHDTMKHTAEAIPEVIRRIRAEGYAFVTLP